MTISEVVKNVWKVPFVENDDLPPTILKVANEWAAQAIKDGYGLIPESVNFVSERLKDADGEVRWIRYIASWDSNKSLENIQAAMDRRKYNK